MYNNILHTYIRTYDTRLAHLKRNCSHGCFTRDSNIIREFNKCQGYFLETDPTNYHI